MRKMTRISGWALAGLVVVTGCGGKQKTSSGEVKDMASDAPAPPSGGSKTPKIQVSKEAQADFDAAVAYYNDQAKGGWNKDACVTSAQRFVAVAEGHPKLADARYNAGLSYQNCGLLKEAETQYQAALQQQPSHAGALANLGQIYFLGGNEQRAKQYWEKAASGDQALKATAARNNLAWLLIKSVREGKASLAQVEPEALKMLQNTLAVENDNVEAYVLLALLHMEGYQKNKSRLTLAKLLLDKAEGFNKKYAPLYNARGLLELKKENVAGALTHFQSAVELDPGFIEARMNVGNAVLGFRKYDEAAAQFEAVLKLAPKNYDAWIGLGIAQRGQRDLDKAEASYKKAQELNQARPAAFFNLGVLYMSFRANKADNNDAQKSMYRQAITFFTQAQSKSQDPSLAKQAKDNIDDCNKNIKDIDDFIRSQAAMPAATAPAPAQPAAAPKKP